MGVDVTRYYAAIWEAWKIAKPFPKLPGACDYTFTFVLGRNDFGFSYGNYDRRYTGPKLDLTGATVKLHIEQRGYQPSIVDASRGEGWNSGSTLCTITGTIIDAEEGEVTFTLDTTDSDGSGWYIGEIEVTDADGNVIVPGYVRIFFFQKLL